MLEHVSSLLAVTFMLGLVTWHVARVLDRGSVLDVPRDFVFARRRSFPYSYLFDLLDCRLCLNTQVAIIFTWGALLTGLAVESDLVPVVGWAFAFVSGPFLVAAWAEIIRRIESVEVP